MHFPDQVQLEADEIERVNRVRVGLILHKLPSEIDAMPEADYKDVLAVLKADEMGKKGR